jgi:hypothetical protein
MLLSSSGSFHVLLTAHNGKITDFHSLNHIKQFVFLIKIESRLHSIISHDLSNPGDIHPEVYKKNKFAKIPTMNLDVSE